MSGPKVTVIGAGSYFFGRPGIHKMATSPFLAGGTLALVDTNKKTLNTMMNLAKRIFAHTKCKVKVIGSTDYRQVMRNSDFIVLTFSYRNAHFRGVDTEIAMKHGIRMCSSDTIGPGGIFRAMRELPIVVKIAKDSARLAPDAWVINFINPTTVLGMGIRRYVPEVRSFALCDGLHEPVVLRRWLQVGGILGRNETVVTPAMYRDADIRIGGVNHCTFLVKYTYKGKNMMPKVREWIVENARQEKKNPGEKAKPRYNWHYALQLFDLYGGYSPAISHTKEYVPFFQGYGVAPIYPEPIRCFDAANRQEEMDGDMEISREYATGKRAAKDFVSSGSGDHATDIIESMWGGLGKCFYINQNNRGAISNLPDDAFVELRSDVDMRGVRPHPFGELPRGILGLTQQVLDTHEMTAEAAITGDKALLRRAMLTDPICNNIGDADACIKDLLEAEKEILPSYWYKTRK